MYDDEFNIYGNFSFFRKVIFKVSLDFLSGCVLRRKNVCQVKFCEKRFHKRLTLMSSYITRLADEK